MTVTLYASDVLTIGLLSVVILLLLSDQEGQYDHCSRPLGVWLAVSCALMISFRLSQFLFQWSVLVLWLCCCCRSASLCQTRHTHSCPVPLPKPFGVVFLF